MTLKRFDVVLILKEANSGPTLPVLSIYLLSIEVLGPFQPVPILLIISKLDTWEIMLNITPLSVKLVDSEDSVSNNSVLVCPNEKIEMSMLQIIKKVVLFMISVLKN